eukprot:TRINITY_DN9109_c0_g3_i2.p1 TRINITY_DN9109_c0_g3~~TRINITY_DN9109_c0_g3_i2.p1  ORF type:complete len:487 (+),score=34.78 TRINITY_DN9109_c0_g3_i2:43-1503(+)
MLSVARMSRSTVCSVTPDVPGYSLDAIIGEGHTSTVFLATKTSSTSDSGDCAQNAVKVFHGRRVHREFAVESRILQAVQGHPNVACMFTSMFLDSPEPSAAIVLAHYAGGSLLKRPQSPRPMLEGEARRIISDVLQALKHIHSLEVIHRDVKPENICVDSDGRSVLIDFDIACFESDEVAKSKLFGTLGFMAPEILGSKAVNRSVDMFSLGALLYFLFQRNHPFTGNLMTEESIAFRTLTGVYNFGQNFDCVNASCKELISSLLRLDPRERPLAEEALQHKWFVVDSAVVPASACIKPDLTSPSVETINLPCTPTSADKSDGIVGAPECITDAPLSPASTCSTKDLALPIPSSSDDETMTPPETPTSAGGNVCELSPPSSPGSSPRFRDVCWKLAGSPRMSSFPRRLRQLCSDAARASDVSTGPKGVRETDNCQAEPSSPSLRPELPKKTNVGAMIRNSFRKRSSTGEVAVVGRSSFEASVPAVVC